MTNNFYNLTFDTVLSAIEKCGFEPSGHCMALNSYENRVYDIGLEDGSHIVTKFYRPGRWTEKQIQEEHSFLYELDDNEIPVCKPIKLQNGKTTATEKDILFAIWPRTGGRSADEFSDQDLKMLGRFIARIHNVGSSKDSESRLTLNSESYIRKPLNFLLENEFLHSQIRQRYIDACEDLAKIYDVLSQDVPLHRIHADCHPGNLIRGTKGWFFLDFDDFLTGPAVQDIWMICGGNDTESQRNQSMLLEGYRTFRDFNDSWLKLAEPLRAMRFIHYSAWLAKRHKDPAFIKAFPHFNTPDYWIQELNDLENQLTLIHSSVYNHPGIESSERYKKEEALSNSDYFWDYED